MHWKPSADSSGVRIFPPAIFLTALLIGYLLHWVLAIPIVPYSWGIPIRLLGVAAFLGGIWLIYAATTQFGTVGTSPNPMEPTTALTFDGPYRYTRNPMYLGMALILTGLAFLGNALLPLLMLAPALFVVRTQVIDREERYLEAKFGDEYRAFKARVRRWF
jgi:protein-S-isoprenylcysteine O-methyltransferase Ste14